MMHMLTSMVKIKKQKMSSIDGDIGLKVSYILVEESHFYNCLGKEDGQKGSRYRSH